MMPGYNKDSLKSLWGNIRELGTAILSNPLFQLPVLLILLLPVFTTIGQFLESGFFPATTPVALLFWPGVDDQIAVDMPVWLIMGAMLGSYVVGIIYLLRKRNLGKVVFIMVVVALLSTGLASILNSLTGWTEQQSINSMDLAGKANAAIISLWHNPVWEEIVFRGIPLLIMLLVVKKVKNKSASFWSKAAYLLLPAIAFGIYHIPGHGPGRFLDTFILGVAFAWMALRFTFFAPLVLHYVVDAMSIGSFGRIESIPSEEIPWLVENMTLFNSLNSLAFVLFLALIPILSIWYLRNHKSLRWLRLGG